MILKRLGILMAVLVMAGTLQAQQRIQIQVRPGGGQAIGGIAATPFGRASLDRLSLIRIEQVQKELKVSDEQGEKVTALVESHREKTRSKVNGQDIRKMSADERRKLFTELGAKRKKVSVESEKTLAEILTEEQSSRLAQIVYQQSGIRALDLPEVQKKLKVSEEQVKKLADVKKEQVTNRAELIRNAQQNGQRRTLRDAFAEMTKKRNEALMGVLTEEQKKAFEELKGKPFELKRQRVRARPTLRAVNADALERPQRPGKAQPKKKPEPEKKPEEPEKKPEEKE